MTKISLIAFDLDGTILDDGIISSAMISMLAKASNAGVKLSTASGRPLEEQLDIMRASGLDISYGFPHYLIADEREIYFATKSGYEQHERHNREMRDAWQEVVAEARKIVEMELERLLAAGVPVRRSLNDEGAERRGIIDLYFKRVQDAIEGERHLKMILKPNGLLTCNRNYCLVQLIHSRAGKGNAVKALVDYTHIPPSEVLCIGDSSNDISMLDGRHGFRAATVSNADDEVKKAVLSVGGDIASKPTGSGVAEIIYRLVLNP